MKNEEYEITNMQMEKLFEQWKQAHSKETNWHNTTVWEDVVIGGKIYPGITRESFIKDGMVSNKYNNKLLFILKEANILRHKEKEKCAPEQRNQINWYKDFTINHAVDNRPKQLEKIGRMYCALVNNDVNPSSEEIRDAINNIAFLNLNKRGGDNNEKIIDAYVEEYKKFILNQIELLNPEYIICLGSYRWLKTIDQTLEQRYKVKNIWHTAYTHSKQLGHIGVDKYMEEYMKRIKV